MTYRVAFIGLGAIGQDVLKELTPLLLEMKAEVLVLRRTLSRPTLEGELPLHHCIDIDEILAYKPQLVIETASQDSVKAYMPACIRTGATVVITSVGALSDSTLLSQLQQLALEHNTRVIVPSGAIGGLDYIQAVRHAPDFKMTYESRKPVQAWIPELKALGINETSLNKELILFEGAANEAAKRYPKNLNVAATLALAGAGMEATQVKVIVDPALNQNKHIIYVSSQFGDMKMDITNTPSPSNPKSSWIVAQSISQVIRRQFDQLQLG